MDINCYMAMTAAEFLKAKELPAKLGWMACHFSQRNAGLCDLPDMLPKNAIIILDDSTPPEDHDPETVAAQLTYLVKRLQADAVLLDFQDTDKPQTAQMASYLLQALPCTVCLSAAYAERFSCPVLLPAPPPHISLAAHIKPWAGREIWLEATLESERITVTEEGSFITPLLYQAPESHWFCDENLCCRYQIQEEDRRINFTLTRNKQMLEKLLKSTAAKDISRFIGLYQQLG